ncbi:MAG: XRE family transcriptional regulator [Mediterranea massiliensis]|nr:XRE family transcriptional regulator [Mediterranea massiliensis]
MLHIGKAIEMELHRQERSVTWFANKLFCDRTNVYKIFKKQSIDTELLLRVSAILKHDFFQYYSEELLSTPPQCSQIGNNSVAR